MRESSTALAACPPRWLRLAGRLIVVAAGALATRLVWEQTVLTWREGPQMVGFALMHSGAALLLLAGPLLVVWLVVLIGTLVWARLRGHQLARGVGLDAGIAALVAAVLLMPYDLWQRIFVQQLATGSFVGEFMTLAAAEGHLGTVKALSEHGVPLTIANRDGQTAVHAAAVENQVATLRYLIAHGAPLDVLDRSGDSPLAAAQESHAAAAAALLAAQGAHSVRGTKVQHERAAEARVDEDMKLLDRKLRAPPRAP